MALVTELLHVFLFITVFIVIHIVVVHVTDRRLSVNIRQKITVEDGPVIQIRSISRQKQRQLEQERRKFSEWEEINRTVSSSFHLKYKVGTSTPSCQTDQLNLSQPITDWPDLLDDTERWSYFQSECGGRNITHSQILDCAYDSGGGSGSGSVLVFK